MPIQPGKNWSVDVGWRKHDGWFRLGRYDGRSERRGWWNVGRRCGRLDVGRGMASFEVFLPWSGVFGVIIVLVGAVKLYVKSEQRRTWGVVILIASALNFLLAMGAD